MNLLYNDDPFSIAFSIPPLRLKRILTLIITRRGQNDRERGNNSMDVHENLL